MYKKTLAWQVQLFPFLFNFWTCVMLPPWVAVFANILTGPQGLYTQCTWKDLEAIMKKNYLVVKVLMLSTMEVNIQAGLSCEW